MYFLPRPRPPARHTDSAGKPPCSHEASDHGGLRRAGHGGSRCNRDRGHHGACWRLRCISNTTHEQHPGLPCAGRELREAEVSHSVSACPYSLGHCLLLQRGCSSAGACAAPIAFSLCAVGQFCSPESTYCCGSWFYTGSLSFSSSRNTFGAWAPHGVIVCRQAMNTPRLGWGEGFEQEGRDSMR